MLITILLIIAKIIASIMVDDKRLRLYFSQYIIVNFRKIRTVETTVFKHISSI